MPSYVWFFLGNMWCCLIAVLVFHFYPLAAVCNG